MSDRGNILFYNSDYGSSSVVISSYWGGIGFVITAIAYASELKDEVGKWVEANPNLGTPLSRLEPGIIAVDFIRYLHDVGWIKSQDRDSGIYLYKSKREVEKVYQIDLNNPKALLSLDEIKYWPDSEPPDSNAPWRLSEPA